jgi:hypothetical protein
MTEWRPVPSYPWLEASSDGRVRRVLVGANGRKPGEIKGSVSSEGYRVTCTSHNGLRLHNIGFHVLVCEAFRGRRPSPDHEAAHDDGIRLNNVESNLRWATPKENAADRKRHGTQKRCRAPGVKLTSDDVVLIRRLKALGYRGSDIALIFDIDRNHANKVAARKAWPDVNNQLARGK